MVRPSGLVGVASEAHPGWNLQVSQHMAIDLSGNTVAIKPAALTISNKVPSSGPVARATVCVRGRGEAINGVGATLCVRGRGQEVRILTLRQHCVYTCDRQNCSYTCLILFPYRS